MQPIVIQGPPMANVSALAQQDLVRYAESLQRYGERTFDALVQLFELFQLSRSVIEKLIAAHEAGDVEALALLFRQCTQAREDVASARLATAH